MRITDDGIDDCVDKYEDYYYYCNYDNDGGDYDTDNNDVDNDIYNRFSTATYVDGKKY